MQAASRLVFWQRPKDVFDGTELLLEATDASSRALIVAGSLSQGRSSVTVDWGDGTVDTVRGSIRNLTHEYGRKGAYRVRISDDIRSFGYTDWSGRTAQRRIACTAAGSSCSSVTFKKPSRSPRSSARI